MPEASEPCSHPTSATAPLESTSRYRTITRCIRLRGSRTQQDAVGIRLVPVRKCPCAARPLAGCPLHVRQQSRGLCKHVDVLDDFGLVRPREVAHDPIDAELGELLELCHDRGLAG